MPSAGKTTIRLQIDFQSNPLVSPFDVQTGLAPQIFRAQDVQVDIGIFLEQVSVDLTSLAFLEVSIYPAPIQNNQDPTNFNYSAFSNQPYPTLAPAPLLVQTAAAGAITKTIPFAGWIDGLVQQASVLFPWTDTNTFDLAGQKTGAFLLVVRGLTSTGSKVVYGIANLTVVETGSQGVYLPNGIAPMDVPDGAILYVQPNQQLTFHTPITIEGEVVLDGTLIQV